MTGNQETVRAYKKPDTRGTKTICGVCLVSIIQNLVGEKQDMSNETVTVTAVEVPGWHTKYRALKNFIQHHGRYPTRNIGTLHERRLADWLQAQSASHEQGTLPEACADLLDELIPVGAPTLDGQRTA